MCNKVAVYSWLSFLSSLYVTFNVLRCRAFTVISYVFFLLHARFCKEKQKKLLCLQKDHRENDSEIRDLKEKVVKLEMEKADCREKDLEIRDLKKKVVKLEMEKAELIFTGKCMAQNLNL